MSQIKINESDHIQGSPEAPVVLVEYADYQCPYCGQAYSIIKQLQKRFGDKMAFVFRNYPIQELHPFAVHAALAAEAAKLQGKFWEMHDIIFENQRHLDDSSLLKYAKEIGLDIPKFEKDFSSTTTIQKIQKDVQSGNDVTVQGTPAFFINGKFFPGNWTSTEFPDMLEKLIKENNK